MTPPEISRLAAICFTNYPNNNTSLDDVILSWSFTLAEVPYENAADALRVHMRESPFFPTASEIYGRVIELSGAVPTPGQAWEMVLDRMRATYPGHDAPTWDAPFPVREALRQIGGMDALRMSTKPGADRHNYTTEVYPPVRQRAIRETPIAWLCAYGSAALEPGFTPPAEQIEGQPAVRLVEKVS